MKRKTMFFSMYWKLYFHCVQEKKSEHEICYWLKYSIRISPSTDIPQSDVDREEGDKKIRESEATVIPIYQIFDAKGRKRRQKKRKKKISFKF